MDPDDDDVPEHAIPAEPRKCIDRRPSSWFLMMLLAVAFSLLTYVVLSAASVPDRTAVPTALVCLFVLSLLLCTLDYARRQAEPGRRDFWQRLGLRPKPTDQVELLTAVEEEEEDV